MCNYNYNLLEPSHIAYLIIPPRPYFGGLTAKLGCFFFTNKKHVAKPPNDTEVMITKTQSWETNFFFLFSELKDFCQNEKLVANCGNDKVIVMETALYGRMELRKDG